METFQLKCSQTELAYYNKNVQLFPVRIIRESFQDFSWIH